LISQQTAEPDTFRGTGVYLFSKISKKRMRLGIGAVAISILVGGAAFAGTTAPQNLLVSSTVTNNCMIGTIPTLNFSAYDPSVINKTTNLDLTANLGLTCTPGAVASIGLSLGANGASAVGTTRAMMSGTNLLSYDLYTAPGHGTVWTVVPMVQAAAPSTAEVIYPIYGQVPFGQVVPTGTYTDTVAITINF
jgi:spore coat protein U-like protein